MSPEEYSLLLGSVTWGSSEYYSSVTNTGVSRVGTLGPSRGADGSRSELSGLHERSRIGVCVMFGRHA